MRKLGRRGYAAVEALDQFNVAGYTNVATHRLKTPSGVDVDKLKAIARGTWTSVGLNRLVTVKAARRGG